MIYRGLLQRWLNRAGAAVCVSPPAAFGCPSLCPSYVMWESCCPTRLSLSVSKLRHVGVLLPLSVSELRSVGVRLSLSAVPLCPRCPLWLSLSVSELCRVGVLLSPSAVPLCVRTTSCGSLTSADSKRTPHYSLL